MPWPYDHSKFVIGNANIDGVTYILNESPHDNGFRWFNLRSNINQFDISDYQWECIQSQVKEGNQVLRLVSGSEIAPDYFILEAYPHGLAASVLPRHSRTDPIPAQFQQCYPIYDFDAEMEGGPSYKTPGFLIFRHADIARVRATGVWYTALRDHRVTDTCDPEYTCTVRERLEPYHYLRDSPYILPILGLIRSTYFAIDSSLPVAQSYTLVDGFLLPFYGVFCSITFLYEWTVYEQEIIVMHLIDALVDFESRGFNISNLCCGSIWLTPDGLKIVDPSMRLCNYHGQYWNHELCGDRGSQAFTVNMFQITVSRFMHMSDPLRRGPVLGLVVQHCYRSQSMLQLQKNTTDLFHLVRSRCTTVIDLARKHRARVDLQASTAHEAMFGCTAEKYPAREWFKPDLARRFASTA